MSKKLRKRRVIWGIIFLTYITLLIYFLFFSDTFGRTVAYDEYRYNLKPFAEINRYFTKVKDRDYLMFFINIIGNILLFVPFGILFPFISQKEGFKKGKNFFVTLLVSLLFCVLIEGIQLITKVGVFDIDDIIMNTTGAVIGYILYRITFGYENKRLKNRRKARECCRE